MRNNHGSMIFWENHGKEELALRVGPDILSGVDCMAKCPIT
jgi:hypothetical protein